MGQVWAVFSDGTAREVLINAVSPDEATDLVLMAVGIDNPQVRTSGEKALRAAFHALRTARRLPKARYAFCYEFSGNDPVIQASASLAFAMKLAQKITRAPGDLAATGIVPSSDARAEVEAVTHINEKLLAALEKLSAGGRFFYPRGNQADIRPENLARAKARGIGLEPVGTVAEAVGKVLDQEPTHPPQSAGRGKQHGRMIWLAAGLLAVLLAALAGWRYAVHHRAVASHTALPKAVKSTIPQPDAESRTSSPSDEGHPRLPKNQTAVEAPRPAEARGPDHIHIAFDGANAGAVKAVTDMLSNRLQRVGFRLGPAGTGARVIGTVRLTHRREIPLRPHAPPAAVVVRLGLSLEHAALQLENGTRVSLGAFSAEAQGTKDREDLVLAAAARRLVDALEQKQNWAAVKDRLKKGP